MSTTSADGRELAEASREKRELVTAAVAYRKARALHLARYEPELTPTEIGRRVGACGKTVIRWIEEARS